MGLPPEFELTYKTHPESYDLKVIYTHNGDWVRLPFHRKPERMYRNFESQGRGNPVYGGNLSGSNSASLGSTSTSTTQQEQVGVRSPNWATRSEVEQDYTYRRN